MSDSTWVTRRLFAAAVGRRRLAALPLLWRPVPCALTGTRTPLVRDSSRLRRHTLSWRSCLCARRLGGRPRRGGAAAGCPPRSPRGSASRRASGSKSWSKTAADDRAKGDGARCQWHGCKEFWRAGLPVDASGTSGVWAPWRASASWRPIAFNEMWLLPHGKEMDTPFGVGPSGFCKVPCKHATRQWRTVMRGGDNRQTWLTGVHQDPMTVGASTHEARALARPRSPR